MKTSLGRSRLCIDSLEATQAGQAGSRQLTLLHGDGSADGDRAFGVVCDALRDLPCRMAKTPDNSMSLLTALASAAATAYALAYMAHAEWGLSRIVIREDAVGMAGVLGVAIIAKMVFQRKNKGS
jgi:hypothetical protein